MNYWAPILAVIFFAIGLILWVASVNKGVILTPETFEFAGFICIALALIPWSGRYVRSR